jgi:hypothetical protein
MHARCVSFLYWQKEPRTQWALSFYFKQNVRLFLDSGAFTLQQRHLSAQAIKHYEEYYADLLHHCKDHLDFYAPVDCERNAAAVKRAMRSMHARGLYPAPIFHGNDALLELERLMGEGYPLILIAQPNSSTLRRMTGGDPLHRYYHDCFELAAKYGIALHGLSQTGEGALRYPWSSVDSSSWSMGSKLGELLFCEKGKFSQFYFGNTREGIWDWCLPEVREKLLPLCRLWGFTLHELIRDPIIRSCFNARLLSHVIETTKPRFSC